MVSSVPAAPGPPTRSKPGNAGPWMLAISVLSGGISAGLLGVVRSSQFDACDQKPDPVVQLSERVMCGALPAKPVTRAGRHVSAGAISTSQPRPIGDCIADADVRCEGPQRVELNGCRSAHPAAAVGSRAVRRQWYQAPGFI